MNKPLAANNAVIYSQLVITGRKPSFGQGNVFAPVSHSVYYRPQRSWAKVIFSQVSVCPQGGGLPQCMLGYNPPGSRPPQDQTPPNQTPPPPWDQTPPPPRTRPPQTRHTPWSRPPREADASIRSMSGRYASYWNAFLLYKCTSVETKKL